MHTLVKSVNMEASKAENGDGFISCCILGFVIQGSLTGLDKAQPGIRQSGSVLFRNTLW